MMGKALSGELFCPCDRSCVLQFATIFSYPELLLSPRYLSNWMFLSEGKEALSGELSCTRIV